jgi:hypothetical protein
VAVELTIEAPPTCGMLTIECRQVRMEFRHVTWGGSVCQGQAPLHSRRVSLLTRWQSARSLLVLVGKAAVQHAMLVSGLSPHGV